MYEFLPNVSGIFVACIYCYIQTHTHTRTCVCTDVRRAPTFKVAVDNKIRWGNSLRFFCSCFAHSQASYMRTTHGVLISASRSLQRCCGKYFHARKRDVQTGYRLCILRSLVTFVCKSHVTEVECVLTWHCERSPYKRKRTRMGAHEYVCGCEWICITRTAVVSSGRQFQEMLDWCTSYGVFAIDFYSRCKWKDQSKYNLALMKQFELKSF